MPIVYRAFMRDIDRRLTHGEAPWTMVVALVATAALTSCCSFSPMCRLRWRVVFLEANRGRHWLTRPETIRKLWRLFAAVLSAVVLAEFLVPHETHFDVGKGFRLLRIVRLRGVRGAHRARKGIGMFLKRPDTYYDDSADDA